MTTSLTAAEQARLRDQVARARLESLRPPPPLHKPDKDPRIAAYQHQINKLTALLEASRAQNDRLKAAHHAALVENAQLKAAVNTAPNDLAKRWLQAEKHILKLRQEYAQEKKLAGDVVSAPAPTQER